jgi:hypothetical protein
MALGRTACDPSEIPAWFWDPRIYPEAKRARWRTSGRFWSGNGCALISVVGRLTEYADQPAIVTILRSARLAYPSTIAAGLLTVIGPGLYQSSLVRLVEQLFSGASWEEGEDGRRFRGQRVAVATVPRLRHVGERVPVAILLPFIGDESEVWDPASAIEADPDEQPAGAAENRP